MAADRPLRKKFIPLLGADLPLGNQPCHPGRIRLPTFGDTKGLLEIGKITKRRHEPFPEFGDIGVKPLKIATGRQMVHTGLKDGITVQCAPQADGTEPVLLWQLLLREIGGHLFWRQIDIEKQTQGSP